MKYINMIVAAFMGISFALAVSHTSGGSLQLVEATLNKN